MKVHVHQASSLRMRYRRARKKGAPSRDMAMPSLSSPALGRIRTMLSASTTSNAPANAAASSTADGLCPTSGRTRCGTTRPTKPITPAAATDAPTVRPTPSPTRHLSLTVSTPLYLVAPSPQIRGALARAVMGIPATHYPLYQPAYRHPLNHF